MKIFIRILYLLVLFEFNFKIFHNTACVFHDGCTYVYNQIEYVCLESFNNCYSIYYCEYEYGDCSKAYLSEEDKKKYVCKKNQNGDKCQKIEIHCSEEENKITNIEECLSHPVYEGGKKKNDYICVSKPEGGCKGISNKCPTTGKLEGDVKCSYFTASDSKKVCVKIKMDKILVKKNFYVKMLLT